MNSTLIMQPAPVAAFRSIAPNAAAAQDTCVQAQLHGVDVAVPATAATALMALSAVARTRGAAPLPRGIPV